MSIESVMLPAPYTRATCTTEKARLLGGLEREPEALGPGARGPVFAPAREGMNPRSLKLRPLRTLR